MNKYIKWFIQSNRWKHIIGGIIIGAVADSLFCAAFVGISVASALEYKDNAWGGSWDWLDFCLTLIGVSIGFLTRLFVCITS